MDPGTVAVLRVAFDVAVSLLTCAFVSRVDTITNTAKATLRVGTVLIVHTSTVKNAVYS
jgi:hypothetical protein